MSDVTIRSSSSAIQTIARPAGWVAVVGLLVLAALWASEPGGADPPASSWRYGLTVTTWDWERHWNYWMKLVCAEQGYLPGVGQRTCLRWSRAGPVGSPAVRRYSLLTRGTPIVATSDRPAGMIRTATISTRSTHTWVGTRTEPVRPIRSATTTVASLPTRARATAAPG